MTASPTPWHTRWLRRSVAVLAVLVVVVGVGRSGQVWLESRQSGPRIPYLQNVPPDAITVRWQSTEPVPGEVRYGEAPDALVRVVREGEPTTVHQLRLTGLKAATRYYYAIADGGDKVSYGGPDYSFVTAPPAGSASPLRFWVQGDPGRYHDGSRAVHAAMRTWVAAHPRDKRPPLDLWLTTGDNGYPSGRDQDYQQALFDAYPELLRTIPYVPVYGNHDARRLAFFRLFTFPEQGEGGGVPSGTPHYFAFDYGNVHFIVLDSQESDRGEEGAMMSWLRRDLAATRQMWRIVLFHHPPYTRATHDSDSKADSLGRMTDMRENFLPLLEEQGVDLVLTGHSHIYERTPLLRCHYGKRNSFRPEMIAQPGDGGALPYRKPLGAVARSGTVYAVVGSTSNLDTGPLDHPANRVVRAEFGSLMIEVTGDTLVASFINAAGDTTDRFSIVKSVEAGVQPHSCAELVSSPR
ncbi:MAG TPA: metallophosphoesterase family protein [Gammaproteobacteria bacterium]